MRTRTESWPCPNLGSVVDACDVVVCTANVQCHGQDLDASLRVLDQKERDRYAGFTGQRAARFAIGRRTVREMLSSLIGVSARAVPIRLGPRGKPDLDATPGRPPLWFSVSHSGDLLAVAISRVSTVGVDVESLRPVAEWRQLASRVLDDIELALLEQEVQAGAAPGPALLRCWCRVEAELKAEGSGFAGLDARRGRQRPVGMRVADLPPLPIPPGIDATMPRYGAVALWTPTPA